MSRPRTTEDIEAVRTRAAVRLERRRRGLTRLADAHHAIGMDGPCAAEWSAYRLVREAAVLVAAIDALLDENQSRYAWGDR